MDGHEAVRCLDVYLGKEGASAEASHKSGNIVHGDVCHGAEHCVDPVIDRLALREGEVCDEPPLPHVVDLRDHPKPDGKPAEVGKGPSIRPKEHSLSRYWVITSECCLADSMFEDAERSGEPHLKPNWRPSHI